MAAPREPQSAWSRPLTVWGGGLLAGVILGYIFAVPFGLGGIAGVLVAVLVCVGVGMFLTRNGVAPDADVAPKPAPAPAPAVPTPPPAPAPSAIPAAEPLAPSAPAAGSPGAGTPAASSPNVRVREAARAAAEAASGLIGEPVAAAPAAEPVRPAGLAGPREGGGDDLKRINGVGPKLEELLHQLGCYHFDQIANWTPAELAWVDSSLEGFHGRASRDDWIGQARILMAGGETEHSKRVDRGEST